MILTLLDPMRFMASKGSRSSDSVTILPSPVMQSSDVQDVDSTRIKRNAKNTLVNDFKMILFNWLYEKDDTVLYMLQFCINISVILMPIC